MINIRKLNSKDISRGVVYKDMPKALPQQGVITSYNNHYIFVAFGNRTMGRGEACNPNDLEFISKSNNGC